MLKYPISITLFALLWQIPASGYQHSTFRSQSTQGPTWLGTASIQKEEFNITVYPDYLDVQLDWEFGIGGNEPESYKDALEIVGNLTLAENSTVVGMLLWNGDLSLPTVFLACSLTPLPTSPKSTSSGGRKQPDSI